MKDWIFRLLLAVAVIALAFWLWRTFFPGPERVIRQQLSEVAKLASFAANEAPLAKMANAQKLSSFFSDDAEVRVEVQGFAPQSLKGREDIFQKALGVRQYLASVNVEFLDVNVSVNQDRQTAVANLTAKIKVSVEKDFYPQELKFTFKKINGKWLIIRIEMVKTLAVMQ